MKFAVYPWPETIYEKNSCNCIRHQSKYSPTVVFRPPTLASTSTTQTLYPQSSHPVCCFHKSSDGLKEQSRVMGRTKLGKDCGHFLCLGSTAVYPNSFVPPTVTSSSY